MDDAVLDALGLLDASEARTFADAFQSAASEVQAQIRDLQAAVVIDESLMPDVTSPAEMKERVLGSVMRQVQSVRSINFTETVHPDTARPAVASVQMWRAAAFVLAGALVAILVFGKVLVREADEVSRLSIDTKTKTQVEALVGRDFYSIAGNPATIRIGLVPQVPENFSLLGTVYVDPTSGESFLLTLNLEASDNCRVLVTDGDGTKLIDRSFSALGLANGVPLGIIPTDDLAALNWTVLDAHGQVLLAST